MWGGRDKQPSEQPKLGGYNGDDLSSNEEKAGKWFCGEEVCNTTWISPIYNEEQVERREDAGKKSVTVGYDVFGDIIGFLSIGLVDTVLAIEVGEEIIWSGAWARSDDPQSPDYWRAEISTDHGDFYIYWGRSDQLVQDVTNGSHPAYIHQCYVVCKRLYFGFNNSAAPNVRVKLKRRPRPAVGNFGSAGSTQGEGMVPAILELLTDNVFGAGLPASYFDAGVWETLNSEVQSRAGAHSPSLNRDRPVGDVVKDLMLYYDGWLRLEGGNLVPGMFPHDGNVPNGLTELSHHDFTSKPDIGSPSISGGITSVTVSFRDRDRELKERSVTETDGGSLGVRNQGRSQSVDMPAIIDVAQATAFAGEALATGSEPSSEGVFSVRRAKAKWLNGDRLQAGDNFLLDYLPLELDQICRIVRLSDNFDGTLEVEYVGEPGVFPLPYSAPDNLEPDLGSSEPTEIVKARIWEVPHDLAGSTLGLPIAVLAQRPKSVYNAVGFDGSAVLGFKTWFGSANTAYDSIQVQTKWAIGGVLQTVLNDVAGDVQIDFQLDSEVLDVDLARVGSQSDDQQADDSLLCVIGLEVFSVGAVTVDNDVLTLDCKRARQGTVLTSHTVNDEAWLVFRDELVTFRNAGFVEDTTVFFKLQPFTSFKGLPLNEAAEIEYTFRDRASERPQISLTNEPSGTLYVGQTYSIGGQVTDINGDLDRVLVSLRKTTGEEFNVYSRPAVTVSEKALINYSTQVVFPSDGTWTAVVEAFDSRPGVDGRAVLLSGDYTVEAGTGEYGLNPPSDPGQLIVTVTVGYGFIKLDWPRLSEADYYVIHVSDFADEAPVELYQTPNNSWTLSGLEGNTKKYFRVAPRRNGLQLFSGFPPTLGQWSDEVEGTSLLVIDGTYFGSIEPPAPTGSNNPVWFNASDGNKPYRWDGSAWADVSQTEATFKANSFAISTNDGGSTFTPFVVIGNQVFISEAFISSLSAAKISSGSITSAVMTLQGSGGVLKSSNYSVNNSGFQIMGNGNAQFNDVQLRNVSAVNGNFQGVLTGSTIQASTLVLDTGMQVAQSDRLDRPANVEVSLTASSSASFGSPEVSFRGRNNSSSNLSNRVIGSKHRFIITASYTGADNKSHIYFGNSKIKDIPAVAVPHPQRLGSDGNPAIGFDGDEVYFSGSVSFSYTVNSPSSSGTFTFELKQQNGDDDGLNGRSYSINGDQMTIQVSCNNWSNFNL